MKKFILSVVAVATLLVGSVAYATCHQNVQRVQFVNDYYAQRVQFVNDNYYVQRNVQFVEVPNVRVQFVNDHYGNQFQRVVRVQKVQNVHHVQRVQKVQVQKVVNRRGFFNRGANRSVEVRVERVRVR